MVQARRVSNGMIIAATAPLVTDDISYGYKPGLLWYDTIGDDMYRLQANTDGAAVWTLFGSGGGSIKVKDSITTVDPCTEIEITSGAVVTDAGGGKAQIAISGGGGGSTHQFSPVDWSTKNASTLPTSVGGDYTVGCRFVPNRAVTITKIRFYWIAGGHTVTVKLWNTTDAAALATGSVVTTGAGWYEYTLATPYVVPANRTQEYHIASMYDSAGGIYLRNTAGGFASGIEHPSLYCEPGVVFPTASNGGYGAGNVKPSTFGTGERYPVEPIFDMTA